MMKNDAERRTYDDLFWKRMFFINNNKKRLALWIEKLVNI